MVWENIPKMWTRMPARNRKNAIWLINQDTEPQLFSMSLSVGTGGSPVYMPAGGASDAPYASLLGRPVVPFEQCQTLGTKGDIILWDPTSYILAQKASGIQADVSIHVAYVTDQSCYRFVYRVDGMPNVSTAVIPANGTSTLSPMVCIETRS